MTQRTNSSIELMILVAVACVICFYGTNTYAQQLDETWTVTVNGQTVQVNPDGSFRIPNISAADQFGSGGTGSAPDFLSDDFLRVVAVSNAGGMTRWAFSEPFQIRSGETFIIGDLTFTDIPPPFPEALRMSAVDSTLNAIGQTTQLTVTGTLADASQVDLTQRTSSTVYRTSNPGVATVGENGLVTANGGGTVFITAVNEGATAVTRLLVAPGDPLTTLEGFVQFDDGTPVEGAEVTILALPGSDITDADGSFQISGVLSQPLTVRAAINVGNQPFIGTKQTETPVPGGITDVGIIDLLQLITETLYASDPKNNQLLTINLDTGQSTVVGQFSGALGNVTEIEWSPDGSTLYATVGTGGSAIHTINPDTGEVLTSVNHPLGGINGLEFDANGNLLGTFVFGPGAPSELVQVDLTIGNLNLIGPTGFSNIGGLAFDKEFGTLYGITSGNLFGGPPVLLSINPNTGAATLIATMVLSVEASSLELTLDGRLLTGGDDGNLYEIDRITGVATLIGPMGVPKVSGLSFRFQFQ